MLPWTKPHGPQATQNPQSPGKPTQANPTENPVPNQRAPPPSPPAPPTPSRPKSTNRSGLGFQFYHRSPQPLWVYVLRAPLQGVADQDRISVWVTAGNEVLKPRQNNITGHHTNLCFSSAFSFATPVTRLVIRCAAVWFSIRHLRQGSWEVFTPGWTTSSTTRTWT